MRARELATAAALALLPSTVAAHTITEAPRPARGEKGYAGFDDASDFHGPQSKNSFAPVVEWQSFTPPVRPGQSTSFRAMRRHLLPGSTSSRTGGKTNDSLRRETYWKLAESQTNAFGSELHAHAQGDAILRNDLLHAVAPSEAGGDEGAILYRGLVTDIQKFVEVGRWEADVSVSDRRAGGTIGGSTRQPYLAGEGGLVYYRHPSHQVAVTIADYTSPDWTANESLAAMAEGRWCFALDLTAYTEFGSATRGLACPDRFDAPPATRPPQRRGSPDGFCDADGAPIVLDMLPVTCKPGQRCCGARRDEVCGAREFATRWLAQGSDQGAPGAWYIPKDLNGSGTVTTGDYDFGDPAGTLAKCEVIARGTPSEPGIRYAIDPDTGHVPQGDASVTVAFEGGARNAIPRQTSEWITVAGGPPKSVRGTSSQVEVFRGKRFGKCCGAHTFLMGGRTTSWSVFSLGVDSTADFDLGYAAESAIEIGSNLAGRNGAIFLESDAGAFPSGGLGTLDVDTAEYGEGAVYPLLRFTHRRGWKELDVPLAWGSANGGDLRTTGDLVTIAAGNERAREPADGAGLRIEGGTGDVSLLWDAASDRLVLSGPPGAELSVFGSPPVRADQLVRTVDLGVVDRERGLAALTGSMATNQGPAPGMPTDADAFAFLFPVHADAPATVKTLACSFGTATGAGAWNERDAIDLCVVEWPPGTAASAIRAGANDLTPCLRLARRGANDPGGTNPAFSVAIDRRLSRAHTALGLALRNGVDADGSADLGARCTIEYTARL